MSDQSPLSPPADITAEWTVHAQLTISRSNDATTTATSPSNYHHRENITFLPAGPTAEDAASATNCCGRHHAETPTNGGTKQQPQPEPVRVVYKWNSEDLKAAGCHRQASFSGATEQRVSVCTK